MVVAIIGLIIAATVGAIIAATVRNAIDSRLRGEEPSVEVREADVRNADRRDERDAGIDRFGGYVGGIVLGVGALLPLGLAMAEREPFWIANALYAALVLSVLVGEMTQAELTDRIGVTRQTIIAIEQGRYSPSLEMAFRIARVFGVQLDEVFQYPDSPEI